MKELNKDIETRDKIIFGRYRPNKYRYGTAWFRDMNVKTLRKLLEQNFIDPEETQNESPTVEQIYEFMRRHPEYTCHGYTVAADRADYRVSIEGVEKGSPAANPIEFKDFMDLFGGADEINYRTNYCWFD